MYLLLLYSSTLGQLNESDIGMDLNVERAWLQGLTGCGIVVAIVDDGIYGVYYYMHGCIIISLQVWNTLILTCQETM